MFDRLTDQSKHVLALADLEATRRHQEYIGSEHLLLGLLKADCGVGADVLKNLGVDFASVSREADKLTKFGTGPVKEGKLPMTPRTRRVIDFAVKEARRLGHRCADTEHILIGIVETPYNVAAQMLINAGLSLDEVREAVVKQITSANGDAPR